MNNESDVQNNRQWIVLVVVIGVVLVTAGVYYWLRIQPQMGASEEAFHTVDALYTAVRNQDQKQLADCEKRLKSLADEGKLPAPAWNRLDTIIQKSRSGSWQSAAETLYDFMLAQRREGYEDSAKPPSATKRKK